MRQNSELAPYNRRLARVRLTGNRTDKNLLEALAIGEGKLIYSMLEWSGADATDHGKWYGPKESVKEPTQETAATTTWDSSDVAQGIPYSEGGTRDSPVLFGADGSQIAGPKRQSVGRIVDNKEEVGRSGLIIL